MLPAQYTPTNVFGPLTGPLSTLLLDQNYSQIATLLNNPLTYENYLQDTGFANGISVAFPTGTAPAAYTFGLRIVVKIAATNTGPTGITVNGLSQVLVKNVDQSAMNPGQLAVNSLAVLVCDGTNFILLGGLLPAATGPGGSALGSRRRNVNGCGMIDQINLGASVTPAASAYFLDNWYLFMTQASKVTVGRNLNGVTPPKGASYYIGAQIAAAVATPGATDRWDLCTPIEGLNVEDLEWGTSNARAIAISFWVYSSVAGGAGGAVRNSATNRSFPFAYTINVANTWQKVSVPIVPDTAGTWLNTNGLGMVVDFSLGAGSNFLGTQGSWAASNLTNFTGVGQLIATLNATFYITEVQVEDIGVTTSPSTPYEKWTADRELAACQRYLPAFNAVGSSDDFGWGVCTSSSTASVGFNFVVEPRIPPTGITLSAATSFSLSGVATSTASSVAFGAAGKKLGRVAVTAGASFAAGQSCFLFGNVAGAQILFTGAQFTPV